uniref:Uncharacterized protein n=2 Tax=Avena sativa TaxID=4498 RepID=A0ACD5VA05_AVESA
MEIVFAPTLDPPNRIPRGRFSLQLDDGLRFRLIGCRHGLVLIVTAPSRVSREKSHASQYQLLVWDPVTDDQHRIAFPPGFDAKRTCPINGAVLRGAGEAQFQVVLVVADNRDNQIKRMLACVYSSETDAWGDLISMLLPSKVSVTSFLTIVLPVKPAALIGGSLYWLLFSGFLDILEFDLDRQKLALIPLPLPVNMFERQYTVMQADGGGLGFLFLSGLRAQLWKRKTDLDGVASWMLGRTIELNELLSLNLEKHHIVILGFAEYNNVVLLRTSTGSFMIQFESLQFKKLHEAHTLCCHNAFESVYTAGTAIGGGYDDAELLHNM